MSQRIIRDLLEQRLMTWAEALVPPIPVQHENADFTPPQTKKYLRFFLLPANTGSNFLAGTDHEYLGVMQISIVTPKGTGPKVAEDLVVSLDALYPNNLRLTSGAVTVQITTPISAFTGIQEEDAFVIPVSATYRAFVV
jgi:hypothetical protein